MNTNALWNHIESRLESQLSSWRTRVDELRQLNAATEPHPVRLGRPFLYATGATGRAGVYRLIELLAGEVDVALAQIGRTDIASLDERVLVRPQP